VEHFEELELGLVDPVEHSAAHLAVLVGTVVVSVCSAEEGVLPGRQVYLVTCRDSQLHLGV
jgi:hypothetical protein